MGNIRLDKRSVKYVRKEVIARLKKKGLSGKKDGLNFRIDSLSIDDKRKKNNICVSFTSKKTKDKFFVGLPGYPHSKQDVEDVLKELKKEAGNSKYNLTVM